MAARCPSDILLLAFDHVDFVDLLHCTHVSKRWRDSGRAHPAYWKHLALTDDTITAGAVSLFLARLNYRHCPHTTFDFTLACSSMDECGAALLLQGLQEHVERLETVTLVITPHVASRLRGIFLLSPRRLREICLFIMRLDTSFSPLSSLFDVHLHNALENITLIDVPVSASLPPISHALKDVTLAYHEHLPDLQHALSWIRGSAALRISSPLYRVDATAIQRAWLPSHHLSLRCENWFDVLRSLGGCSSLSCLVVGTDTLSAREANHVLPAGDDLCLCIKTEYLRMEGHADIERGVIAVTTPDQRTVRLFDNLSVAYTLSGSFFSEFIPAERIVTLVVSLAHTFMVMCVDGYCFPRLETLCLGVAMFPEDPWKWGAVTCPNLRTLAFQASWDGYKPFARDNMLQSFIGAALKVRDAGGLRIVLRDVGISGVQSGLSVSYTRPRVHWLRDTGLGLSFAGKISTEWMDVC